jgi:hypothetical protein
MRHLLLLLTLLPIACANAQDIHWPATSFRPHYRCERYIKSSPLKRYLLLDVVRYDSTGNICFSIRYNTETGQSMIVTTYRIMGNTVYLTESTPSDSLVNYRKFPLNNTVACNPIKSNHNGDVICFTYLNQTFFAHYTKDHLLKRLRFVTSIKHCSLQPKRGYYKFQYYVLSE